MPDFDMDALLAAASAHVLTESELRGLAMISMGSALDAVRNGHYGVATVALDEALGHIRALRERKK
jgi:hypothetical protein